MEETSNSKQLIAWRIQVGCAEEAEARGSWVQGQPGLHSSVAGKMAQRLRVYMILAGL